MLSESNRSARLEALVPVKRAAEIQGRSLSDFVVAAAQAAAHRAIEETSVLRLSAEDQRRFVEALLNPPNPAPALMRAKEAHAKLFGSE